MRSLTVDEIERLEAGGCSAEDWTTVTVSEDFTPDRCRNVRFCGTVQLGSFARPTDVGTGFAVPSGIRNAVLRNVTVGDNCIIENVGCYISGVAVGDDCYIANVGTISTNFDATFGQGNVVPVLNEAGQGNVVISSDLTGQMAAFMIRAARHDAGGSPTGLWDRLRDIAVDEALGRIPDRTTIGDRVKILNTRELINVWIGDDCEINGASRLTESTLAGVGQAPVFIGTDVICEGSVVQAGSSITDGARLVNCFVGEACHIGSGFTASSSLFFANSHMENGEACAAFCGPFSVSHHKSTLLIGVATSFYNAGSATNFSNHAYKLGPVHYGTLGRGCKTASGAHLLLPAVVGDYSVCIGKIQTHPDVSALPFSYLIADGADTYVVPARNLLTSGLYRDITKWPRRDQRPRRSCRTIVNFDWFNPAVMEAVARAADVLEGLVAEQGADAEVYSYGGCLIKKAALQRGIAIYGLALKLYLGEAVRNHFGEIPDTASGTSGWTDLAGFVVPEIELDAIAADICAGSLSTMEGIESRMQALHSAYDASKWAFTYRLIMKYLGADSLTSDDMRRVAADGIVARRRWLSAVRADADKEAALGDVEDRVIQDFTELIDRELKALGDNMQI